MLLPTQSQDSLPPPPYTSTPIFSSESTDSPFRSSLRGGDAQPSTTLRNHSFESATPFFEDRPCTVQYPSYVLKHVLHVYPDTTRDHLAFPQPGEQWLSRDVSLHDWNTFLNYLLPVDAASSNTKGTLIPQGSRDLSADRDRIDVVLADWHEGFFGPRGIQIEARFPADSSSSDMPPPPPFTSSVNLPYHHPEADALLNQGKPLPSRSSETGTSSQPPIPAGQSALQWARTTPAGTMFEFGPLARLLSNNRDQKLPSREDFRSRRERHGHEVRERRGRSSSSSSTASDSHADGRRRHHMGGRHRRRRSSRSSSSSSLSSSPDSSIASISSSDFSGLDLGQIRHSLATLRADPDRKAQLSATVRQFKSELRQSRRQHRDSARGMRNETKGLKGELKAQRKEIKAELKSFIKDARAAHKADRKVRKAERKAGRAQRRAERRGTGAHAKGVKKVAKAEAKAVKAQSRVIE
ncbi:MAG: hypothetical protein Q9224_004855, partial [Gallowayella concinna]